MNFTDIFIKKPVLATVVSLLILVIGLRAALSIPVRQYPRTENAVVTVTTAYYGGDRAGERYRLHHVELVQQSVDDYRQSAAELRLQPRGHGDHQQDQLGAEPPTAAIAAAGAAGASRADH